MHNIQRFESYGEFRTDDVPDHLSMVVGDLYRDAEGVLEKTVGSCISVRKAERSGAFNDFTDDARERKINDALRDPRQALHTVIRTHLVRCEDARKNVLNRIKAISTPKISDDPSEQIANTLKYQEIRNLLRGKEVEEIKTLIENDIESGNGDILKAVSSAPDNLLPQDTLEYYERQFAFREMPKLQDIEEQVEQREKVIRKKCSELNSTQLSILQSEGFSEDPLSRAELFETFTARNPLEQWAINKQIDEEKSREKLKAMNLSFDEDREGVNLEA